MPVTWSIEPESGKLIDGVVHASALAHNDALAIVVSDPVTGAVTYAPCGRAFPCRTPRHRPDGTLKGALELRRDLIDNARLERLRTLAIERAGLRAAGQAQAVLAGTVETED